VHQLFLNYSVSKLRRSESRIASCLDLLSKEQVWWREADTQNAIGNLVLHLCGNVGQWVLSGVGGRPDIRDRDREFAARESASPEELKASLHRTIDEAVAVIENVPPDRLTDRLTIQGYDLSVLEAIYNVVEHFGLHTGQILYATKLLTQKDLGFYRHLSGPAPVGKNP
jgi:hypothetical protein